MHTERPPIRYRLHVRRNKQFAWQWLLTNSKRVGEIAGRAVQLRQWNLDVHGQLTLWLHHHPDAGMTYMHDVSGDVLQFRIQPAADFKYGIRQLVKYCR